MSFVINPDSGPVANATIEHARENMKQLAQDIGEDGITIFECKQFRNHDGRFTFTLSRIGYRGVEIEMPGLPLEQVRYVSREKQNVWDFPRLYIDGSSHVWMFVIELAKGELTRRWFNETED